MGRVSRVLSGAVRSRVLLLCLVVALCLGAHGCVQREDSGAPAAGAMAAGEGDPSASKPGLNPGENTQVCLFDLETARVGDKVLGMEIASFSYSDADGEKRVARVNFSGRATVSGSWTHEGKDEEMFRCQILFQVDEGSEANLPREKSDPRQAVWFMFTNHDEAERLLGPPGSSGQATVEIENYSINRVASCEPNTAKLVRVVETR